MKITVCFEDDRVATYSADEIDQLATQLEDIVNRCAPDDARTHAVYRYAMECERDFFQAAFDR